MNEQITKLIIEANKYATEKHPIADDADSITKEIIVGNRIGESQRKLAELIVQECCDWIDGSPTSESGCQLLLTKSFIIANLKGHFGL